MALVIKGTPDPKHIATSCVERQNWSLTWARPANRLATSLINARAVAPSRSPTFQEKTRRVSLSSATIENHAAAVALNYFAYNFIRIHRSLRVTLAMAAGVTTRLLDVSDIVRLLEELESKKAA